MESYVAFLKSSDAFKPDTITISFGENGSMVIHLFALTKYEAKELLKRLTAELEKANV